MSRRGPMYVYVMTTPDGRVKVGRSGDPDARRRYHAYEQNAVVVIKYVTPCLLENATEVETMACRLLRMAGKHVSGEWFEAYPSDAVEAIARAINICAGDEPEPEWPEVKSSSPSPFSMRLDPKLKEGLQRLADKERRTLTNFVESKLWEVLEREDVVVNLDKRRK